MKTFKEEIIRDKYSVKTGESDYNFLEDTGYSDEFLIKVFFNKNNSGTADFSNFMNADELWFEDLDAIKSKAKELDKPYWTVISFYRENGYSAVYENSGKDALTNKCNNWVRQGRDGYLFIVFAKEEEEIDKFTSLLQTYINEGSNYIEIYDEEDEEFTDDQYWSLTGSSKEYEEWKQEMIKKYEFEEDAFPRYF